MGVLLIGFATGMVVCDAVPDCVYEAVTVALIAGAVLLHAWHDSRPVRVPPLLLVAALGYLSLHPWTTSHFPVDHFLHRTAETPAPIVGRITETEISGGDRSRFRVQLEAAAEHAVSGAIRLTVAGWCSLQEGDRIRFTAKLYPVSTYRNPGGFDVRRYLRFSGIDGTAFVRSEAITLLERRPSQPAMLLRSHRLDMAETIDRTDGSDAAKEILKAVLIGIRSGIPAEVNDGFAATGLSHLLAISGLHVGIVAAWAFFVFYRTLAVYTPILLHAWGKKAAALLSLIPVVAYGLLSGMAPSTQRAVLMTSVVLVGLLIEREHDPFNTLALAAWGILIVHPPALFFISFQLSFASVSAILVGTTLLAPYLAKPIGWREKLLLPMFVTVCATIGTLALVMFHFQRISLVGLAANALVVPMMSLAVIPVGLMGATLHLLHLPGAMLGFEIACGVLDRMLDIVRWFGSLPWASIVTFKPTVVELVWFGALLALTVRTLFRWTRRPRMVRDGTHGDAPKALACSSEGTSRVSVTMPVGSRLLVWAWIVVWGFGAADAGYWLIERYFHSDLRVTVLDVGQGLSVLVEEPMGRVMLIDGGGLPGAGDFDVGKRIVAPALCAKKILSIDRVVLSHPDGDHFYGLLYILSHFRIGEVWTNGRSCSDPAFGQLIDILHRRNIPLKEGEGVPALVTDSGIVIRRLHPDPEFSSGPSKRRSPDSNNFSLVLSVRMGEIGFLFPADIETPAESRIVERAGELLQSTVLVAPHHGSKSSSSQAFIDAVRPDIVIFSAGHHRYFPHPEVIERYRQAGCHLLSTAKQGAIAMRTDGRRLAVHAEPSKKISEEMTIDGDV